ncbi:UCH domain-containing protein/zf-UBP domain-containing protein [Cephalotus follicularis]|uniref:Ubiquitin carboxyl-terminal hydrolase n=1 Tax=Cephalotus follicularis TaxID=3775 RepID=A0A1Q3BI41_CEPFO|nr:UCH domain-containing protein/zf-UBP domain-containing protein [Cephalotus follicularis]
MGKRVKKKSRGPPKEKRVLAHSMKVVPQQSNESLETVHDGVPVVKDRKLCGHLDKGIDFEKLAAKIGSSDPVRCEDCRQGSNDRRGSKAKGRHGKKGSASGDSKSESKAVWVCLECGHYACGGIGLPITTQSHVIRHVRQHRHPLVIQWENPHLRWCFPCNSLIPIEKIEENGERKDALLDIVKLIKGQSTKGSMVDVEDVWFGSGSVSEVKFKDTASTDLEGGGGYVVRGLSNLGNTCFFNSVLQNLLSMERLRDYFLNQDVSVGPLSIALKKLYAETIPESGIRNVVNPRSLFGCLCSKAPQFRGYQQHDSHELLRCLLDGLSTEGATARIQFSSSKEDGKSSNLGGPTFVDSVFGGQVSSTVCCVECGHYSTVYEPFLDLSLSVPTKKPQSRKAQAVAQAKKKKLPPKRGGRIRPKVKKDTDSMPAQSISYPSASSESPCTAQSPVPLPEKILDSSIHSSTLPDSFGSTMVSDERGSVSQSVLGVPEAASEQAFVNTTEQKAALPDDFTWIDYLGTETTSDVADLTSQYTDLSFIDDSGGKDDVVNYILVEGGQVCSLDGESNRKLDSSSVNPWEDELQLQVQDSEVLLLPYKVESSTSGQTIKGEAEASSSVAGCVQEEVDFDGFGDLFNEPETAAGPIAGPSAETGLVAGNNSDSDPDEVDNTDTLVSIDSCLAHFVKPELLSDDNAWDCENCTRIMQKLEAEKKGKRPLKLLTDRGQTRSQSNSRSLYKEISCTTEVRDISNTKISSDFAFKNVGESIISQNEKIDGSNKNCTIMENGRMCDLENGRMCDFSKVVPQCKEEKGEMNDALLDQSDPSGCYKSCNQEIESEHKVMDRKGVKAKRVATKRVLIDKTPPILTIHLKRFSQDARGRLSKLNGHVNFGETIDLRPYIDPRWIDQGQYVYRLIGVVVHQGSMRQGHYIAYVRGQKENDNGVSDWYYCSDDYVHEVSLEEVLCCEAYILFYEKVGD